MMSSSQFDLVTVGGGLGASALAISMARRGARVLVLEKELQFRDRVRGEGLAPWAWQKHGNSASPTSCWKVVPRGFHG
jgi:flavin-dependent dehydrogenase